MNYQLIIIGAGPGGYETAYKAAKEGLQVLLIEAKNPGGTCLNVGCIPTKCLCRSAECCLEFQNAESLGVQSGSYVFSLARAIERKDSVVEQLRQGILTLLKTPGLTYVTGKAHFVSSHAVQVDDIVYTGENIIIATGAKPKRLPIEGAHLDTVITSDDLLQHTTLPKRLCIIGGGVIGMEFASIFQAFGSEVTVVEYDKEILPGFDKDIAKRLRTGLKKRGILIKTGAGVEKIERRGDDTIVIYQEKGSTQEVSADVVLMAVGRKANFEELSLENALVEYSPKGIIVDENMQTTQTGVYAIGDVNGLCQLAHAASAQGKKVLQHIQGKVSSIDFNVIPAAVFTYPEVAMVGLTEESASAKGVTYTTHKAFYRANGKALAMNESEGYVKILANEDDEVIGAHIMGAHASDLIHQTAQWILSCKKLSEIRDNIFAHPTLSEILQNAAE